MGPGAGVSGFTCGGKCIATSCSPCGSHGAALLKGPGSYAVSLNSFFLYLFLYTFLSDRVVFNLHVLCVLLLGSAWCRSRWVPFWRLDFTLLCSVFLCVLVASLLLVAMPGAHFEIMDVGCFASGRPLAQSEGQPPLSRRNMLLAALLAPSPGDRSSAIDSCSPLIAKV